MPAADDKSAAKPAKKAEPAPPVLGSAAESSDPAVHNLLAQRGIAELNGDDEAVQALNEQLAALGVK